jgi:hypothetical protein
VRDFFLQEPRFLAGRSLDAELRAWRNRRLEGMTYPFLFVDVRYEKVRVDTRVVVENPDVMAYEIGHLGWQVGEIPGARVHDILGLTSPEVYGEKEEWKPQNLLRYDPEYIMIHHSPNYPPVRWLYRSGILENRYERIASVEADPDPYLAFVRTELEKNTENSGRLRP